MSVQFKDLEHNLVKLTVEIPAEEVDKAQDQVFLKNRNKINIPGFRKGKAPRVMVERTYGKDVFLEDAVNDLLPVYYQQACDQVEKEQEITLASYPEIDFEQVEVGKPVIFVATVAKKPAVVLGEYKGLEVEVPVVEVTDEDIAQELKKEQEKNATFTTIEGRPVADGDMITLDFLGKVDGAPFEGGEAKDYPLTIGSHSFIDGFEEQLIGMNAGETKDVEVTFPENYHAEDLKGKPAVFTCTVNSIKTKELPALDDEFAAEVSDFETLEEYKADVRKKLEERNAENAKNARENGLLDKAVENAEMDIPELMVESEAKNATQEFAQRLQSQGMSMETYLQYLGMNEQQMIESQKDSARTGIKSRLVLEAIADAEQLEATEEDIDAEVDKMAEMYNLEKDNVRKLLGESQLDEMKHSIRNRKALEFLSANAK